MSSRHIILGAGAALFLAVAAPLSAQQPTKAQADSACRSLGKSAEECKTQTQSGVTDSSGASTPARPSRPSMRTACKRRPGSARLPSSGP